MVAVKNEINANEKNIMMDAANLAAGVTGVRSPKPTVVMVTQAQ